MYQTSLNYALQVGELYLNKVVLKNQNSGSLKKGSQKNFLSMNRQVIYLDLGDDNIGKINILVKINQAKPFNSCTYSYPSIKIIRVKN